MKNVKLLNFEDLPNESLFETASFLMRRDGLTYGVYEYEVG